MELTIRFKKKKKNMNKQDFLELIELFLCFVVVISALCLIGIGVIFWRDTLVAAILTLLVFAGLRLFEVFANKR